MNYKNMGDLICALRKQRNMTQKDLADKLNVTDKAVSKWERGLSCPDINTIPELAGLLNISVEELLHFQEKEMKEKSNNLSFSQKVGQTSSLILKAVGMAMGIAVLVLSIVGDIETSSAITMLAVGLTCICISQFQNI